MKRLFKFFFYLNKYLYVMIFRWFFYDSRYLKGRWFSNGIYSQGWLWAARDIHNRIWHLKHSKIRWPISPDIDSNENIEFHPDDLNIFNGSGCYYQCFNAKIIIGKGTYIAKNVGLITSNHKQYDLDNHEQGEDIIVGKQCWIGMNAVILPGVVLEIGRAHL